MSLNTVPAAERVHIGFYGRRNAGKSSLVNAVTGQDLAIVSDVAGTTTDPVTKTMELLPIGPVVIIDTPGIDDEGELGALRVEKSYRALAKTNIAVIAVDSSLGIRAEEEALIARIKEKNIPYIVAYTKSDLNDLGKNSGSEISVSSKTGQNINELKELIGKFAASAANERFIISDKLSAGDMLRGPVRNRK